MTLRSRLATTYAAIIFLALLIFAAAAVISIDRTLRTTMDTRLRTEAYAASSLSDIEHGHVIVDEEDRRQFSVLLKAADEGLVFDPSGKVVLSSVAKPPNEILALRSAAPGYHTVGKGDAVRRALVLPIERGNVTPGTVVVWRASDWIDETDRGAATAFAAAALIIAVLAVFAGGAVTRGALEDAFARQRRFSADASHELRAPLAVIRAEADLALRKERPAAEYRSAMESIAAEADSMEALIGDLLSAARAESGAVRREPVELSELVRRVADRLSSTAAAKDAAVDVHAERSRILGDPHAIERALLAIGHNAVKYAPAGGRVDFDVRETGHAVEVRVRDNGSGFSPEALLHGMERFWRDDASRSAGGTGLGLAIAQSIVRATGGTVILSNTRDGAEVLLRFPAAPRSD